MKKAIISLSIVMLMITIALVGCTAPEDQNEEEFVVCNGTLLGVDYTIGTGGSPNYIHVFIKGYNVFSLTYDNSDILHNFVNFKQDLLFLESNIGNNMTVSYNDDDGTLRTFGINYYTN